MRFSFYTIARFVAAGTGINKTMAVPPVSLLFRTGRVGNECRLGCGYFECPADVVNWRYESRQAGL